jgi:hypothetical protein
MKKKFITGLLLAGAAFVLASCVESTTPTTAPTTALPPETTTKTDPTPTTTQKEVGPDEVDFGDEKDPVVLKSKCMQQLNSMYQEAELSEDEEKIANVVYIYVSLKINTTSVTGEAELKVELNTYYKYMYDALEMLKKVETNLTAFKAQAKLEIDLATKALSEVVKSVNLDYVNALKAQIYEQIDKAPSLDEVKAILAEYSDIAIDYAKNIVSSEVEALIANAKGVIDGLYQTIVSKVPQDLKEKVESVYKDALVVLSKVHNANEAGMIEEYINEFKLRILELKDDLLELTLDEYKALALEKLDELVGPLKEISEKYSFDNLTGTITQYYTTEKEYIEGIVSMDTAKQLIAKVAEDTLAALPNVKEEIISLLGSKVQAVVDEALKYTDNEEIIAKATEFIQEYTTLLQRVEDVKEMKPIAEEMVEQAKELAKEIAEDILKDLKEKALTALDNAVTEALSYIEDEDLKAEIQEFYETEVAKVEAIKDLETAKTTGEEILAEAKDFFAEKLLEALDDVKAKAKAKLDTMVNQALELIPDETLRQDINTFYQTEVSIITQANDLESLKAALESVEEDTKAFLKEKCDAYLAILKQNALSELSDLIGGAIQKIPYEDLQADLTNFKNQEIEVINGITDLETSKTAFAKVKKDTQDFIAAEISKAITYGKATIKETLDGAVADLLTKIEDENLKSDINDFYTAEMRKVEAIDSLEKVSTVAQEIASDTETFVANMIQEQLAIFKNKAIDKLDEYIEAGIAKLPNDELKQSLRDFKTTELTKVQAVNTLEDAKALPNVLKEDVELYVKELVASTLKEARDKMISYVAALKNSFNQSPYDYVPKAMTEGASIQKYANANFATDYTTNVAVDQILKGGYGEQWNMVLQNMDKCDAYMRILSKGETIINLATTAVNEYLNSKYADSLSYTARGDNYSVSIDYSDDIVYYNIVFTTPINVPLLGEVTPTIQMEYDGATGDKTFYISITNENAIRYVVSNNSFEFGLSLGLSKGKRTSYVTLSRDESNNVTGHLYEYVTVGNKDAVKSCADFYIGDTYATVVGNKASGMVAFSGYINELYNVAQGDLIGYEVREELSAVVYNTLWFNLADIDGINSVKVLEKSDANESSKSTVDVYINGSSKLLVPTYNKKAFVKTSRKYDIELRTRHYYTYDADKEEYVDNEITVPMMFIQEGDNFNTFAADFLADNQTVVSVALEEDSLNKILDDYDTYIDIFIENKELMDSNKILAFIHDTEEE